MASRTLRRVSLVLVGVVLVVGLLLVLLIGDDEVETAPSGSFYETPSDIAEAAPGELLRSELLDEAPAGARAWRVLYATSSGAEPESVAASGVVFAPSGPAEGDRPVVVWAHGTVGIASSCAPSLQPGAGASLVPGLEGLLDAGYVVAAPDYPGLGTEGIHPYLVGLSEGHSVLDSVRAAAQLEEAGAGHSVVVQGESQGGHAALFASQLQPGYAPELDLRGVAVAAPAVELKRLLQIQLTTRIGKILGAYAAVSWASYYPEAALRQVVPRTGIPVLKGIAKRCLYGRGELLANVALGETLRRFRVLTFSDLERQPWARITAVNTPTAAGQHTPLFIAQSDADLIVAPETTDDFVSRLCRRGLSVRFHELEGTHPESGHDAAPQALRWTEDRFQDRPAPSTCP